MTDRAATWLAGGVWGGALVLAVAAGVLQFLTRDVPVGYFGVRGFQGVLGLAITGTGWLIASRRVGNPIGWILVGAGFVSAIQAFNSAYVTFSVAFHEASLPATNLVIWLSAWIWVLIVGPLSTYVLMLFPDGRLETRGHRALAAFSTIGILAFAGVTMVAPGQASEVPIGIENPFAVSRQTYEALGALHAPYVVAALLSIGVLARRFRRSRGELRQQMKWITYAGTVAAVALVTSTIGLTFGADVDSPYLRVSAIAMIIGFGAIPVAAGVAILRYGLYEIDVVINKTIVYAVLAAFITVVYVGMVVGVGALVGAGASTELSIAATAIVAVAVQPVRARATHLANRLVFGKRATPYEALSEFSARLSEQTEAVLPRLARLMTEATAADRASVWLAVGGALRAAASWPPEPREPRPAAIGDVLEGWDRVFPVRHEGELLGALAVATRSNEPLTTAEDRLLNDLSSQAGLLLRNARLIEELRASRQRLVAAQDMERRRIERNLHDGAQQQLVALAVNLNLLGRVLGDAAPEQARQMIEQLRADATDALENLRDLARGIYPPLLAERGLVAALESQAAKAPLQVIVEGNGSGRFPQEAESAVYFCVLEALQNAAKYARASGARVRVWSDAGTLGFEVRDDGEGFDVARARRGAGLTNMADRLEALGGRLEVRSEPGAGTIVSGWVAAPPIGASA